MSTKSDLPLSCTCGEFAAVLHDVGPKEGTRLVCYCDDCRDFLRVIDRAELLDEYGGNPVYQTRVAKLEIIGGADKLATLHMTDKPTMRWYTTCCRTPLFNTASKAKPAFLSVNIAAVDSKTADDILGPSQGRFASKFAERNLPAGQDRSVLWLALRAIPRVLRDTWSKAWKQFPLFDPVSREPLAAPRKVTREERAAGVLTDAGN